MIVPMKKISLVVLAQEQKEALGALRDIGLMHVEKREAESQDIDLLKADLNSVESALAIIKDAGIPKDAKQASFLSEEKNLLKAIEIIDLRTNRQADIDARIQIQVEIDRIKSWGKINPNTFNDLREKGLDVIPYEMLSSDFKAFDKENMDIVIVSQDKKTIRFVLVNKVDKEKPNLPEQAKEFILPEKSSDELIKSLNDCNNRIDNGLKKIQEQAIYFDSLNHYKSQLEEALEFETIYAGMPTIVSSEENQYARQDFAWLTGYVPHDKVSFITDAAKENNWAYICEEPGEEDAVPTKIKNNRFANLISPLMDFLGTVPGYREADISLWFLIFFGIFFAMIFGDAGYGALLVLITIGLMISNKVKGKGIHVSLSMLLYLGLMTIAWGTITCSWFGISTEILPSQLTSLAIPAFSNANPESANNIKIFCFTLGLIQISLAHVIGLVKNIRSLKSLGEVGALMLAFGMYYVVLSLVVDGTKYPLNSDFGTLMVYFIVGGFLINFLFINYEGKFIAGIVESLKDIISMILGVVNMFGDIMSYIRLWAVGLAGAAISATINQMAGPFLGGFIIFAGALLLLFGHGLNMIMNVLSVIVHGVRLNTLEFSNHLGLTWSGFKYEPFSKTVKK